jgi:hypothetical protein
MSQTTVTGPTSVVSLADVLASRRWWRRQKPFPHVVATDVLREEIYAELVDGFRDKLGPGGGGYLSGHDIHGCELNPDYEGPLTLFVGRPWHDMLANVVGVTASGHVSCGLHRHVVGSSNGFPHNDLNPGWFLDYPSDDGICLADSRLCRYTTGELLAETTYVRRKLVRAVAAIFYLDNAPWNAGDGGTTGLYRNASDPVDQPRAVVPPVNNSLLVFECTPFSFHGFISNRRHERNSVVLWLHRSKAEVGRLWGEQAIVPYAR